MFLNIFYLVLAIIGLGFLIFIHELGHYFVARRTGMKVEIFSIGFGPVLRQWEIDGVKWQLCALPFGGYVRIAGMEKKGGLEPYQIPDGFYGKTPLQRIKVALAGPISNIVFAFIAFTLIWIAGGQQKFFQELTHVVGYVDSDSILKNSAVRPGDVIFSVDGKSYHGYNDLLMKIALSSGETSLQGDHMNYWTGQKTPFSATLLPAQTPIERINQLGILPAQYLIFDRFSSPASPLKDSGIQKGDRLIWADGALLFSQRQLSSVLNDSTTLLTIQRGDSFYQIQVPRLKIADLRLSQSFKNELDDWRHAALNQAKLSDLYFIPYQISSSGVIEDEISFMNANAEEVSPSADNTLILSEKMQSGDRIVAVDGMPIQDSFDLFKTLQDRRALLIVQKKMETPIVPWEKADSTFISSFDINALKQIIQTIGTSHPQLEVGNLKLLPPVRLKSLSELDLSPKIRARIKSQYEAQKKEIEKIENSEMRELQLSLLEQSQKRLMLGASLVDHSVSYNPPPTTQFAAVFQQTWKTLSNLFSGSLTPKSMSGPVGIVQALQQSWANGVKNALYWLGFVSLNLAILNLLPIPVLDGGHILFSAIELVTKKPIRAKTMQKWVVPFLVLLVVLFVYLTYQDIIRLLHRIL